jgi:hypothetical protein
MRHKHGIRGIVPTPADREKRATHKMRKRREPFGVYRPLTEASNRVVFHAVTGAAVLVRKFFAENRDSPSELVIPADFGVTFVPKKMMRYAVGRDLGNIINTGRIIERLEQHSQSQAVALPVPLDETKWFSNKNRKLVYRLKDGSHGKDELDDEQELLRDVLDKAKAHEVLLVNPDHITLMKYGTPKDGNELSTEHKDEISVIVEAHFRQQGIGEIVVGALVAGDGYTDTLESPRESAA